MQEDGSLPAQGFSGGRISKEEYQQFAAIYSERAAEAEQAADKMKAEMEEVLQKGLLTGEWLSSSCVTGTLGN